MDNVFIYQSVELPDFCRSPKGTVAVFFCEWNKLQAAQNRITGKFKHTSQPVNGSCTIKSFNSTDPATGVGFKVLLAEVVKPLPARKKRGRKLGGKNKGGPLSPDNTVKKVSGYDKMIPLPSDYKTPVVNAPQTITVAYDDGQKQIDLPAPKHPSGHYNIRGSVITYRHNPALDASLKDRSGENNG